MRNLAMLLLLLATPLAGQTLPERTPKTAIDNERLNDNVNARREYDANARALLNPRFRDALDRYQPGNAPSLTAAWGEFVAADGTPFIALQLVLPPVAGLQYGELMQFFGAVEDSTGHRIATYNESLPVQLSHDDLFVERSLVVPLKKSSGTFGVARRGEIIAMARVDFEPDALEPTTAGVSRLILSRDVYILKSAQRPLDPFAFGGTKVIPKPDASFRKTEEVWVFAELRNPSIAEDRTPHITTKTTFEGPTAISGPPVPAIATPLKGAPGHYGLGNPIDVSKLAAGDYKLRVVITDLISKQAYRREATLHIRDWRAPHPPLRGTFSPLRGAKDHENPERSEGPVEGPSLPRDRLRRFARQRPRGLDHPEKFVAVAFQVRSTHRARQREHIGVGGASFVLRLSEQHAELRHRRCKLQIGGRLIDAAPFVDNARSDQLTGIGMRIFVAQAQLRDLAATGGGDFVKRGDRMPRPELAGVFGVVCEVFVGQRAVLVSDLAIGRHDPRIEFQLYLHVLRDRDQRSLELVDEDLLGLVDVVEIVIITVTFIGKRFHEGIFVVVVSDADAGQIDALLALFLDDIDQRVAGHSDVEVAVGGEDDAIVPVSCEILLGGFVGQLDSCAPSGRAAGLELVECGQDRLLVGSGGLWQHDSGCTGVNDDGHRIFGTELLDQQSKCRLEKRQTLGRHHRSRDVEQKDEIVGRELPLVDRLSLDADAQQAVIRVPWASGHFAGHAERPPVAGLRIAVREVIDHLFDADGFGRRKHVGVQKSTDVGVRGAVDIDRESGGLLILRVDESVLGDLCVFGSARPLDVRHRNGGRQLKRLHSSACDSAAHHVRTLCSDGNGF